MSELTEKFKEMPMPVYCCHECENEEGNCHLPSHMYWWEPEKEFVCYSCMEATDEGTLEFFEKANQKESFLRLDYVREEYELSLIHI